MGGQHKKSRALSFLRPARSFQTFLLGPRGLFFPSPLHFAVFPHLCQYLLQLLCLQSKSWSRGWRGTGVIPMLLGHWV